MANILQIILSYKGTVSSCTSGFMKLDYLKKNAELIGNGRRTIDRLSRGMRLFPSMNFTCSGNITGMALVAGIGWRTRKNLYPEIQTWRNINETDQFTRQASQEILLNPGDFSTDGVLQYNLTTPISFQSGDVLGVYQPRFDLADTQLQYTSSSNAPDSYHYDTVINYLALQDTSRRSRQLLLLSLITGTRIYTI